MPSPQTIAGNARASSAFCRPDAWSHVITAAVPLSAAALHVSRRRLIQPGDAGSTNAIRLRTYSPYDTTAMCTPYHTAITAKSGPARVRRERHRRVEMQQQDRQVNRGQQPRKHGVTQHPQVSHLPLSLEPF